MSHEIYEVNGKKSMAYTGETPWHGLGNKLTENADIDTWKKEAGLIYTLESSNVHFFASKNDGSEEVGLESFDGNVVLYRSDNQVPLSIVSNRYKVVQPGDALEFFREFTEKNSMKIETAGSILNGSRYWALAKMNGDFDLGDDVVKPYMLLASSCDGKMSTIGQKTFIRVVCNNTFNAAIGDTKNQIKIPHSREFNSSEVKEKLGLIEEKTHEEVEVFKKMKSLTVNKENAVKFFMYLLSNKQERETGEIDINKKTRQMTKILNSHENAPGSEDTVWGLMNAVTHSVDYNPSSHSPDTRLNSAWFGTGANLKAECYKIASNNDLLEGIIEMTQASDREKGTVDRILDMVDVG